MEPIALPVPYRGINEGVSLLSVKPPFCVSLFNFKIVDEGIELRKGNSKHTFINFGSTDFEPVLLSSYGDSRLILAVYKVSTDQLLFYNVTVPGAPVLVFTAAPGSGGAPGFVFDLYFNNRLFFFNTNAGGTSYVYDGTSFTTVGYTASFFRPLGGSIYKNRAYFVKGDDCTYWYSGINAIAGPVTPVDLSSLTKDKTTLAIITSVTISDTVSTVELQVFIFANGEVLFYSGDYPDSATWTLQGKATISPPLSYRSIVPYQGDTLLLCQANIISLRDLFLKGSQGAAALTVNVNIQRTWRRVVQDFLANFAYPGSLLDLGVCGVWEPLNNRIIISFPFNWLPFLGGYRQPGGFCFVFNTIYQSWEFHGSTSSESIIDMNIFNGQVLMLYNGSSFLTTPTNHCEILIKEGATDFLDVAPDGTAVIPYDFYVESAIIPELGENPETSRTARIRPGYVHLFTGMDIILNTDMYDETIYRFRGDLGTQETLDQTLPVGPVGILQKPFVNIGIEANYLQYLIYGETAQGKTVGLKIYGTNIWIDQGASPR